MLAALARGSGAAQARSVVPVFSPVPVSRTRENADGIGRRLLPEEKRDTKMAGYLSRATIIGNLGKDPEVRTSQGGDKIVSFSVATTESWKDRHSGERRERTEWHRVVIFGNGLADIADKYLRKGLKVMVEGALQTRKWTDQQGAERYSTEIVLKPYNSNLILLDGNRANGMRGNGDDAPADRSETPSAPDLDDEIPF